MTALRRRRGGRGSSPRGGRREMMVEDKVTHPHPPYFWSKRTAKLNLNVGLGSKISVELNVKCAALAPIAISTGEMREVWRLLLDETFYSATFA